MEMTKDVSESRAKRTRVAGRVIARTTCETLMDDPDTGREVLVKFSGEILRTSGEAFTLIARETWPDSERAEVFSEESLPELLVAVVKERKSGGEKWSARHEGVFDLAWDAEGLDAESLARLVAVVLSE